jgi:hypothetical protein
VAYWSIFAAFSRSYLPFPRSIRSGDYPPEEVAQMAISLAVKAITTP